MADMLKRQDRAEGRSRTWRSNFRRLQREVLQLEDDEAALDAVFPQVGPLGCARARRRARLAWFATRTRTCEFAY